MISACASTGRAPMDTTPSQVVPERIGDAGWVRAPEMERFAGDSLFQYIDGAAEMYHKYGFTEVTVAKFLKEGHTITADLYHFESPDGAFGMYSTLRPDGPDTVMLGMEGFLFGSNLVFVRGSNLLNVYTYDDFVGATDAVRSVAQGLEENLPETSEKPAMFTFFPTEGRIPFTERIFAEGFLGYGFLNDVYTVDYSLEGERVRLFLCTDPAGAALAAWMESSDIGPSSSPVWMSRIFGAGDHIGLTHDYHGEILAGRRGGKLLGMVGYLPAHRDVFTAWVRSLE